MTIAGKIPVIVVLWSRCMLAGLACWLLPLALDCAPVDVGPRGVAPSRASQTADGGSTRSRDADASPTAEARPPPRGLTPAPALPAPSMHQLASGLRVQVVEQRGLPVASLHLVLGTGSASDGPRTGLASLAAAVIRSSGAGGWSAARLEDQLRAAGAQLKIATSLDTTRLSLTLPSCELDFGLKVLAALVQRSRMTLHSLSLVRRLQAAEARRLAAHDAVWATRTVLQRELFTLPTQLHPYAVYAPTAEQIEQLSLADCQRWYRTQVTPNNARLLLVGRVETAAFIKAATEAFAGWKGPAPAGPHFTAPLPPARRRVELVDNPAATRTRVCAGMLGPAVQSGELEAVEAVLYLLADPLLGSLTRELVQVSKTAKSVSAGLLPVAHGPVPILVCTETRLRHTAVATQQLLDQLAALRRKPPSEEQAQQAAMLLLGRLASRAESAPQLAELYLLPALLGLPENHPQQLGDRYQRLGREPLKRVIDNYLSPERSVLAVSADAKRAAKALARFGPVDVLEPNRDFTVRKRLAHDPSSALRIEEP